ncbi:MAG: hypothetical protein JWM47_1381 [Acidimicrobiales bacterium]|nr:hypothetical protein [Acidimicrobiales bacterium]
MLAQRSKGRGRRRIVAPTERLQREGGSSLIIALSFIMVIGILVSAITTFAYTNLRTSRVYRELRNERYAGDGAVEAAINSVRTKLTMGRDPDYNSTDPPCVYTVGTGTDQVTVTCSADPGSESGVPNETGLVPPQAITALGQRHNEVGPLNETQCSTIGGLGRDSAVESSLYFRKGEVRDYFEEGSLLPCGDRNRPFQRFIVRGSIRASGRLDGVNGSLQALPSMVDGVSVPSSVTAQYGCGINVTPACQTGVAVSDPGNGGTVEAYKHVPINWTKRTEAYSWNGSALVANPGCANRSTIIFLPGWYDDANLLNRYTNDDACAESTIWLAPDAGADGKLLTKDDKTGAFYFGFTNTSLNTDYDNCIDLGNHNHRWCIGGESAWSSPRVVTGTPKDWNPLNTPGSATYRTVTLGTANTVDSFLSVRWAGSDGAKTIGDGLEADYKATGCIPFTSICFSTDRAIRVRDFSPQVTAGPYQNKISVAVAHRATGSGLNNPTFEVRAVTAQSGQKNCGTSYTVPLNTAPGHVTQKLRLGGGSVAQQEEAAALAIGTCMNTADLVNGLQVTMKVTGNGVNSGGPRVYLDGYRIELVSEAGASFPAPAPGGQAAQKDCDKDKAGAQLIFGSDSHVYIPDGSLEVCAGPYPTSPGQHQQIGIFGVKAVDPVRPSSVTAGSGTSINNTTSPRAIAEVPDRRVADITYSTGSTCGFCTINFEGRANVTMGGYSPPSGLSVAKVEARVTYDSNNPCFLGVCAGSNSQLQLPGCTRTAPKTSDLRSWQTDVTGCFSDSQLASGVGVTWVAKAQRICGFWICGPGSYTDQLDGVELLISLQQNGASQTVVPASGCTVAYPNYWEGAGAPDCAIVRADSKKPGSIFSDGPDWVGRYSVEGTIYAPSHAMELDDTDAAYPTASRGVIVRHIRVKGFANRSGYAEPSIDTQIDTRPTAREATFIACKRTAVSTAKCGTVAGDRVLTRARVHFTYLSATDSMPEVLWWTDER